MKSSSPRFHEEFTLRAQRKTVGTVELPLPLADKVAFLREPLHFPEVTRSVQAVETNMSWVFLTERHAYKLKKPTKSSFLDYSTIELRKHFCEEEVRLNERLSSDVYLGIVPLVLHDGRIALEDAGTPCDWLVKMRRLPADRMLDRAIESQSVSRSDVKRVANRLVRFYRNAPRVVMSGPDYVARVEEDVIATLDSLSAARSISRERVRLIHDAQLMFVRERRELLASRASAQHILEAHGDLRPEHVCLESEPQIIDCLEFNERFRQLDPVDELAFFAMECEHLGEPWIGISVYDAYCAASGERPPAALAEFYATYRAALRAKLALWHLRDDGVRERARWPKQAARYLELAADHAAALLLGR